MNKIIIIFGMFLLYTGLVTAITGDIILQKNYKEILTDGQGKIPIDYDVANERFIGITNGARVIEYDNNFRFNKVLFNISQYFTPNAFQWASTLIGDRFYVCGDNSTSELLVFNITTGVNLFNSSNGIGGDKCWDMTDNGDMIFLVGANGDVRSFLQNGSFLGINASGFQRRGLEWDGTNFWNGFESGSPNVIRQFDDEFEYTGVNFTFVGSHGLHLIFNESDLFVQAFTSVASVFNIPSGTLIDRKTVNLAGGERGFAFDGTNWFSVSRGDNIVYIFDNDFNFIDNFDISNQGTNWRGITFANNNLYLVEDSQDVIYVFDTSGILQFSFSTSPILSTKRGIHANSTNLFVAQHNGLGGNANIGIFDFNGVYQNENITLQNPFTDMLVPSALHITSEGILVNAGSGIGKGFGLLIFFNFNGSQDLSRVLNFSEVPLNSSFAYGLWERNTIFNSELVIQPSFDTNDNFIDIVYVIEGFSSFTSPLGTSTQLFLNNTRQNIELFDGETFNTFTLGINATPSIFRNGTLIANNSIQDLSIGFFNYTAIIEANLTRTSSRETFFATVIAIIVTPPTEAEPILPLENVANIVAMFLLFLVTAGLFIKMMSGKK